MKQCFKLSLHKLQTYIKGSASVNSSSGIMSLRVHISATDSRKPHRRIASVGLKVI
jgi:hypothetical protein